MHCSVLAMMMVLLSAGVGFAQVDGLVTPYIGTSLNGDLPESGQTLGLSVGSLGRHGFGAEVDLAHGWGFDPTRFEASGITSLMANVLVGLPRGRLRPFGVAGLGLLRTRGCEIDCVRTVSRTDVAANFGGGVSVPVSSMWQVRSDVRYFRYVQHHRDVPRLAAGPYDFWRWSVGVTYDWPLEPRR